MERIKNISLPGGASARPILTDVFLPGAGKRRPVIVYAHGFNGFKDWGGMDRIAEAFAEAGFAFVKFNFSHSGTTAAQPEEFADPEAYGLNSYTKELHDLEVVLDWVSNPANSFAADFDATRIGLIGHSRGGGIVLLKAAEDKRVKAVSTWASVAECKTPWGSWSEEKLREWKQTGVEYITNGRTGQILPLYYTLHEDFLQNRERLDIEKAVRSLKIPLLIVHGTADTSVPIEKAHSLHEWKPDAETFFPDTDHVFGRKHPWTETDFPEAATTVVVHTTEFFARALRL